MSQLNQTIIFEQLLNLFAYSYILGGLLFNALIFYPIGILLTLYVVGSIIFMVIQSTIIVIDYLKYIQYYLIDLTSILDEVSQPIKYFLNTIWKLWQLMDIAVYNFSVYSLLFYIKRIEFRLMLLFVVLSYC